nr:cation transporter [uncultured Desulfobacter sp.]
MTDRIKAASLSLLVVALITGLKFILYYLSGSIAVLSEAWHSFSDIATTLLVLTTVFRRERKHAAQSTAINAPPAGSLFSWLSQADTELKTAGFISLVLLTVSMLILWRAIFTAPASIERPLVTGIIFIGLSFGSFFLYRFQDMMGRKEDSAALRADSLHNQADMAISLLTGLSLILYYFGYNIDRWVSVYIALFIFSFAVEMLLNVTISIIRGSAGLTAEYRFTDICRAALRPRTYTRTLDAVSRYSFFSNKGRARIQSIPRRFVSLRRWLARTTVIVLALAVLQSLFYTVGIDEQALVLRFGQIVEPDRVMPPGLHWKLPWPVDQVHRVRTSHLFSMAAGNTADADTPMIWQLDHGDTTTFISGDNNLFLPYLILHYRIKNPQDYYLSYRSGSADRLLEYEANRILTQTFVTKNYYDIALFDRRQWTATAQRDLQHRLDEMKAGLEIVSFCLRDLHPPKDIAASYENVVAAYQNQEQSLNRAQQYYNTKLPETRNAAHKAVTEAQSMALSRLKQAQGEAENYKMRLSGFRKSGDIGKIMLSHRAAVKNLKGKALFLIDPKSGIDGRMLYFENFMSREDFR